MISNYWVFFLNALYPISLSKHLLLSKRTINGLLGRVETESRKHGSPGRMLSLFSFTLRNNDEIVFNV